MKAILVAVAALSGVGAMASQTANLYTCSGAGKTDFSYSTTSLSGKPVISASFRGDSPKLDKTINTTKTVMGSLVSVSNSKSVALGSAVSHYTVLIPNVVLDDGKPEKFDSFMVRTETSARGSHAGVTPKNEFIEVSCEASFVYSLK